MISHRRGEAVVHREPINGLNHCHSRSNAISPLKNNIDFTFIIFRRTHTHPYAPTQRYCCWTLITYHDTWFPDCHRDGGTSFQRNCRSIRLTELIWRNLFYSFCSFRRINYTNLCVIVNWRRRIRSENYINMVRTDCCASIYRRSDTERNTEFVITE